MFIAGSFYGIVVPLVRTAQNEGFSTGDIMVTQYLVSTGTLALMCLFFSRKKVPLKDAIKLMGVGLVAAAISYCYYQSLLRLSPATSLTLLFQFVWMGMVVEAVRTRKMPGPTQFITVLMVVVGAVFATGMLDEGFLDKGLDPLGVIFGLLSAVGYTAFLVLAGRVATHLPALNRSMFNAIGSLIVSLIINPMYFANPLLGHDPLLSLALGILGICFPVFLISLSSPKLPAGLATVMASSELPSGVICAAIFMGEPVSLTMGIGVVILLLGIVFSEKDSLLALRRKSKKAKLP